MFKVGDKVKIKNDNYIKCFGTIEPDTIGIVLEVGSASLNRVRYDAVWLDVLKGLKSPPYIWVNEIELVEDQFEFEF